MGRRLEGTAPRDELVAFRLNPEESKEMRSKMAARGQREKSSYFRDLMHEDGTDMTDQDQTPEEQPKEQGSLLGSGVALTGPSDGRITLNNQSEGNDSDARTS